MLTTDVTRNGADLMFAIVVRLPVHEADVFAEALTGDDEDIVLAGETEMRRVLEDSDLELEIPAPDLAARIRAAAR